MEDIREGSGKKEKRYCTVFCAVRSVKKVCNTRAYVYVLGVLSWRIYLAIWLDIEVLDGG